jgi:hypothetical protein
MPALLRPSCGTLPSHYHFSHIIVREIIRYLCWTGRAIESTYIASSQTRTPRPRVKILPDAERDFREQIKKSSFLQIKYQIAPLAFLLNSAKLILTKVQNILTPNMVLLKNK